MNEYLKKPSDSVLPHLSTATDPEKMREVFQEYLFTDSSNGKPLVNVKNCEIQRIKYKPGKTCLVCYKAYLLSPDGHSATDQILLVRVYEPGGSGRRFEKTKQDKSIPVTMCDPVVHIPDKDMIVWVFPNDRKLKSLFEVSDPEYLRREILPGLVEKRWGPSWEIRSVQHSIVHYKPEDSCMVRVESRIHNPVSLENRTWVIFGKIYYEGQGPEIYTTMKGLWNSARRREGALKIACPLAYFPGPQMLWQEGLPGAPLFEQDRSRPEFLELLRRAGKSVANFHQTPVSGLRRSSLRETLDLLRTMKDHLIASRPSLVKILSPLVERLLRQAPQVDNQITATLHGDLHLNNILFDGADLYLIDLDAMRKGHPVLDLASFAGGILTRSVIDGEDLSFAFRKIAAFLDAYQEETPWDISPEIISWHISVALVNERAFRALKGLKASNTDLLATLVQIANEFEWKIQQSKAAHHAGL